MAVPKQSRKELVAAKAQIDPAWDPELSAGQRHLAEHLEEAQRVLKRRSGGRKAVVVTVLGALALGFYGYVFHSVSQEWFFGDREEAAAGADREAKSATS
ncbi:cytochrome c oxidase assembly factor 3 homolog, mitochondrial [Alligator mississippiensis]|uniref:cytochrome c oxidase assembly factor 3 homolog, mitochondrial n=1 Tax=Alligator mississippiensis TaxID=8496 RepID=UPI0006EC6ED5|nr:cytochrome c oxidase assembly factor 3 homolog, mitochondrial [Alligator mississippiensis]